MLSARTWGWFGWSMLLGNWGCHSPANEAVSPPPPASHAIPVAASQRGVAPPVTTVNSGPARWGKRPVLASAGCRASGPAAAAGAKTETLSGERTLDIQGVARPFIVSLPKDYDGTKPYPLAFGFHGKTRTHEQCKNDDCRGFQTVFGERAILVYMKSLSLGWREEPGGFAENVPFFDAVLDTMKAEYCVDESRVIVAGTSSGAFFSNQLACIRGSELLAVVPVGGALGDTENCQNPVAALVIHGIDDSHVTFDKGEATRDYYRGRNGCSERTTPSIAQAHRAVRSERDAGQATFHCVDYQDCQSALPVRWCEHGEGGYDNSTHAWPTFGGQMIGEFLDQLGE